MPRFVLKTLALAALALCAARLDAQPATRPATTPADLPPGTVLFDSDRDPLPLVARNGGRATASPADAGALAGQPFDRATRVEVAATPPQPYDVQLVGELAEPLARGHTLLLTAHVRGVASADETNEAKFGLVVEQAGGAFDKETSYSGGAAVGAGWRTVEVPFRVGHDHADTGSHLTVRLGLGAQAIEVGGVTLVDYGPGVPVARLPGTVVTYAGHEPDAPWRAEAEARIEAIRKGDLTVAVVDAAGNPVAGASVRATLARHAYAFGCVYNPSPIAGSKAGEPDSATYRDVYAKYFKVGVDEWAMKWPGWEDPDARQTAIDAAAWVLDHGIALRGHCMVWPSWKRTPADLPSLADDPAAMEARVAGHIEDVGTYFAGKVIEWDVVNEPYNNNDLLKTLGRDAMATWFKLARAADPTAVLYLNEAGQPNSPPGHPRYDVFYDDLTMLKGEGAPIGGIGMQGHFGTDLRPPAELWSIYDRFATFGLPIRITELDIDVDDEQLQADYLRDFMTATFAHPATNGIILWGFWENHHWRPKAALWRADWSLKPVGQAWIDLVYGQWSTDAAGETGPDGRFAARGFYGDYDVTVTAGGKSKMVSASMPSGSLDLKVTLD